MLRKRTASLDGSGALRRVSGTHRRADDSGMTLIEVVIASVLLGVLAASVLAIMLQAQSVQVGNRARIAAANLAAREIDMVREEFLRTKTGPVEIADAGVVTNPHPLDGGTVGEPLELDGVPYTVVRSAAWNITVGGQSACEGGSLVAYPTLGVTVTVTWPDMGTIKPVVSTAIFAPEKGTGVAATSSFIAVTVTDSAAEPNAGRTVRVESGAYVRTGVTDPSGCAVIEVQPAAGLGTEYTVSLGDAGYVDIGGNETPSKTTGLLAQGRLNNGISFAYDLAGTARVTLVDPDGGSLTDDDVTGAEVTLVAAEYSGSSGNTVKSITGVVTTIAGLWPTQYGAYFGVTPPVGGYDTKDLEPGGTIDLEVPFELAETTAIGMPAGTTSVVAVPSDGSATTCTSAGARTVDPNDIRLVPGNWDFFAVGADFGCSPGPREVLLDPGPNDPVEWADTTVEVIDAPPGTVWALERSQVAGSLTTCPGSGDASDAVDIDAARAGPLAMAAGDWYLYVTDGAADGACVSFPTQFNPRSIAYRQATTVSWPAPAPVTVTVTNVPSTSSSWAGTKYATILASTSPTISCQQNSYSSSGTVRNLGSGSSVTTTSLGQGTWYIFGWNQERNGAWNPRCRHAGTVVVGWNSPLTLAYNSSNPPTVGP